MKTSHCSWKRHVACWLVILTAAPFAVAATPLQQSQSTPATSDRPQVNATADGAANTSSLQQSNSLPDAPKAQTTNQAMLAGNGQTAAPQSGSEPQQNDGTKPLGTAVAPYENPVGVAATRPAGAVIAPGKQRREHVFLIRAALIVGAGVAIGTVVALSHASPGRPN